MSEPRLESSNVLCSHFQVTGPGAIAGTVKAMPYDCPWCKAELFRVALQGVLGATGVGSRPYNIARDALHGVACAVETKPQWTFDCFTLEESGDWVLTMIGPEMQAASFTVPGDSVRAEVIRQFNTYKDKTPMCDCPEVCKVCGGRVSACKVLGHRAQSDRSIWHDCKEQNGSLPQQEKNDGT